MIFLYLEIINVIEDINHELSQFFWIIFLLLICIILHYYIYIYLLDNILKRLSKSVVFSLEKLILSCIVEFLIAE